MKNIFIILILLLCINVNAQEKSKPLLVSLEKDSVVELGVELVFENTTSDTLMLLTKFENFLGITKSNSGFMMVFHKDHRDFSTIVDELLDNQRHYVFNNGRVLISPHCKVKFKIDLNIFLNGIKSVGEYGVDFHVNAFYRKLNVVDSDIKSFFLEKTNYLVLKKINSSSGVHENPEKSTTNPQPYVAVKVGKQEGEIPFGSMDLNVQDEAQATVTFANDASSLYALDTWQNYYSSVGIISGGNGDPNSNFDGCKYEKISANYWVKWKYIPPGKTDKVTAELLISDKAKIDPAKVVFKTKAGKVFESSYNATTHKFTITLLGGEDKDGQELYAMHPATESGSWWNLGKLDIMSYAPVERKMVLVKTSANDNTDAATVQTELNRIYNPVGISWSVSSEQFIYNTDNIFEGKSGIISTYLPNMRTLNASFIAAKADKLEPKTAYLFLVNQTAGGDRDKQGFMPRGMQFGYINTSTANVGGVIAHELGHGAFKLYHTFNSGYGSTAVGTQGKTENLMDYKGGINLAKWQWDQMYDPAILNGVFDSDKEAEYATDGHYYTVQLVALMMGFTPAEAEKLGAEAENPDSYVKAPWSMEERYTYIKAGLQQEYHALTGRTHGVELALTTYALLKTHRNESNFHQYLLHRFGDCFGHIKTTERVFNLQNSLSSYINAVDGLFTQYVVPKIKSVPNDYEITVKIENIGENSLPKTKNMQFLKIYYDGKNLLTTLSVEDTKKELIQQLLHSYSEMSSLNYSHNNYLRNELVNELKKRLPSAVQNNYEMYGNSEGITPGHTFDNFSIAPPDDIGKRKELYYYYIDRLIDLLSEKYNTINFNKKKIKGLIQQIIDDATDGQPKRLDGVLAFECEYYKNPNSKSYLFSIPIKYNPQNMSYFEKLVNLNNNFEGDAQKQCEVLLTYLRKRAMFDKVTLNTKSLESPDSKNYLLFEKIPGTYNLTMKTSYDNKSITIEMRKK